MATKQQALESLDKMLVTYCDEQRAEAFNEVRSYIIEHMGQQAEIERLRLDVERLLGDQRWYREALNMVVTSGIGWDTGEYADTCDDGRTPAEVAKAALARKGVNRE